MFDVQCLRLNVNVQSLMFDVEWEGGMRRNGSGMKRRDYDALNSWLSIKFEMSQKP